MKKINDNLIEAVHRIVNNRLYKEYPCLGMANLKVHTEGSIKLHIVKRVLEAEERYYEKNLSNTKDLS